MKKARKKKSVSTPHEIECNQCHQPIVSESDVFLVEQEVGRRFCSQDCIMGYFKKESIEMEREYFSYLRPEQELSAEDRKALSHLAWQTLEQPEEIWSAKSILGDLHYYLIASYEFEGKTVWSVAVSLMLQDEPSYLYLAFVTQDQKLVNMYRRGEQVYLENQEVEFEADSALENLEIEAYDGLAEDWKPEETWVSQSRMQRKKNDIPEEQFHKFEEHFDETLKEPDEVWRAESFTPLDGKPQKKLKLKKPLKTPLGIYHFIKKYQDEAVVAKKSRKNKNASHWYVIIARETKPDSEELEILDAFPTVDLSLVERHRHGKLHFENRTQLASMDGLQAASAGKKVLH